MRLHDIAVVGASGLVGRKILQVLNERKFEVGKVVPIASDASVGKEVNIQGKQYRIQKLTPEAFRNIEFAFFSAGGAVSSEWAPIAANERCLVIDNSSAFRMKDDVPLVVTEVNRADIFKHKGIIANPNCSTIQLVVVLKPLDEEFKIKRVVVSTYQSVSGAGHKGISALENEITKIDSLASRSPFPYQIAYNAIPQVDVFFDDGYTKEELKMINETRKIIGKKDLNITATCVRIPSLVGHGESVNIEFEKKVTVDDVKKLLIGSKGVKVVDNPVNNIYPMPIDSVEKDDVFVGRIRTDNSVKNGINLWIVADNVRKGAATNAVQIAEEFLKGK
ncbi:MAG: aspartate-semialdehyde dehydrogenase [Chlorobi bacterium]|nr:aspartate-semialdehyde dehydrogenase [Chlorobiota bacterium]MCI0715339.1 aspartate-semialdehyde dehydrogenase [Chlorobiota bacterium]